MPKLYIIGSKLNEEKENVILWNEKSKETNNILDIFTLIDKNNLIIRKKYLEWIFNLQNLKLKKNKIIKLLKIDHKFSLWWMHPISEKSNFLKSFHINEILKVMALEEFLKKKKITEISTTGLSDETNRVISLISNKKNIFFNKNTEKKNYDINIPILNFFKSIAWLIVYLFKRRSLFGLNLLNWKNSKNKIIIANYLFDIDYKLLSEKKFATGYWGNLIDKLAKQKIGINWLNIFFEYEEIPDSTKAKKIINKLNKVNNQDVHVTLDTFLNFNMLFKSLKIWIKIFFKSLIIKPKQIVAGKNKNIYFPIIEKEFFNNLQNHHSLKNILIYFLMNEALSKIVVQKNCIFPNENQPWEMALMNNYKFYSHKNIIGYQHSTTRFWDLRTFYCRKQYNDKSQLSYPKPNKIAVHSKIFYNTLIKANYPKKNLKLVETLKYKKLLKKRNSEKKIIPNFNKKKTNITLVLGAFRNFDEALVNCLKKNLSSFNNTYSFYLKEQLSSDEVLEVDETQRFKKVNGNLLDIFKESDLVIISNPSSAVIDAMYTNTPFFVYDGGNFVNFSPMYGVIDKRYFIREYNFVSEIKNTLQKKNKNLWKFDKNKILEGNVSLKNWQKIIDF
jgi:surface carbohydrate biosynthesis protein (TIGR04326 family)